MQLDVNRVMSEAVWRQAVALGAMTEDGELADPAAQARVERDPTKPVLVALRPLPGEDAPVEYLTVREVIGLRSITEETLLANAAVEREGWQTSRAPRTAHPSFRAWGGPSAAPAPKETPELTTEEAAAVAEKEAELARRIARWRRAQAIPDAEVFGALLADRRVEFTGSGDLARDTLLLALAARVERLEARILELEGGAK